MSENKRDSIAKKIQLLKQKTVENGCSESEALSAMQKISELMHQYNLTLSEVEIKSSVYVKEEFTTSKSSTVTISGKCSYFVGLLCNCKIWHTKPANSKRWHMNFFGTKQEVENAIFYSQIIENAYESELNKFKNSDSYMNDPAHGKTKVTSFRNGMSIRLMQRIQEILESQKMTITSEENALMRIKNSHLEKGFEDLNLGKMGTLNSSLQVNSHDAYLAGKEAGNKVNLNPGINYKQTLGLLN